MYTMDLEEQEENSMQALFLRLNRSYAEKCLYQIREMGFQPSQMPVIMVLHRYDGCSQRRIAELLRNKPSTVNVSIQRLEKAGIVCRRRDETDQRIMRVYFTEEGKQKVKVIKERVNEMEHKLFRNFSDTELCLLKRFFLQMLENLDQLPGASVEKCNFMKKEGLEQ